MFSKVASRKGGLAAAGSIFNLIWSAFAGVGLEGERMTPAQIVLPL